MAQAVSQPKDMQVAARIRVQIAAGLLSPGEAAPSGAALARATGFATLTCRKALRTLIKEGVLVPGASPGARPRVAVGTPTPGEQTLANAARVLSASLASRRRACGLTQPQLAAVTGMSVTSIGHAETGRLWQSRRFWELADKGSPEVVRVRASYVADEDIRVMADIAACRLELGEDGEPWTE
jgi:DNA-binding transcriptional MocR family regulator